MTVEEFFEWQSRQDRNYELVDGVPVLHRRQASGSATDRDTILADIARVMGAWNSDLLAPRISEDTFRLSISGAPMIVLRVISPWHAGYDALRQFDAELQDRNVSRIVLVDTESPRSMVFSRTAQGWISETVSGHAAVVDLPEIDAVLPFAELYADFTFSRGA